MVVTLLHLEVMLLLQLQTETMSVGTTHSSGRMPESAIHHARRERQGQPLAATSVVGQQMGRLYMSQIGSPGYASWLIPAQR